MSGKILYCPIEGNKLDLTKDNEWKWFDGVFYINAYSCDQCFSKFTYNTKTKEFKGVLE